MTASALTPRLASLLPWTLVSLTHARHPSSSSFSWIPSLLPMQVLDPTAPQCLLDRRSVPPIPASPPVAATTTPTAVPASPASASAPSTSPTAASPSTTPAPAAPESWPWRSPDASLAASSAGNV